MMMFAEILGVLLKLGGVAFVIIAAIGVLRLPDPFLRMHAATKAGTLGAGLVLMGVALAFGDGGTAIVALLTILFLLATLPIAAHLLGRAAYVSGADLWAGTTRDDLRGVLPRDVQVEPGMARNMTEERRLAARQHGPVPRDDREAGRGAGRALVPAAEPMAEAPLPDVAGDDLPDFSTEVARERRALEQVAAAVIGPDPGPVVREAAIQARTAGCELVGLALLDEHIFEDAECLSGAKKLREVCRARLAEAVAKAEAAAEAEGVRLGMHFEEGDIPGLLAGLRRRSSLLVLPARGWFHHGVEVPSGCYSWAPDGLLRLAGSGGAGPMLLTGAGESGGEAARDCGVARVLVVDDGSDKLAALTAWMLQHNLFPEHELCFVPEPGRNPSAARRTWMLRLAETAGRTAVWLEAKRPDGLCLLDAERHWCDVMVMSGPPYPRRTDWFGHFWQDRLMKGWRGRVLVP